MTEIVVRQQKAGERALVCEIALQAFGRQRVADLVAALQSSAAGVLSLVAEVDAVPVGHVQLSRGWLDAPRALVDVLVLSPLGVLPEYQRRGIGGELIRAAIAGAEALGAPALFLEGHPDYYRRFGFRRASALGFTAPSTRIPDPAFQVITFAGRESWMAGALVYPDAFWAFDSVGLRD